MIKNSAQKWEIGETVKVGFLSLKVIEKIPTPGDFLPDKYILENNKSQKYEFIPHNGLTRIE